MEAYPQDIGHGRIRLTPWDRRALGFGSAEILWIPNESPAAAQCLGEMESWCAERDVRYLFGRFPAERGTRAALERRGFSLVETTLLLGSGPHVNLPRVPKSLKPALSIAQERDIDQLAAIAESDFHFGRYIEDPLIDEASARARNGFWLRDLFQEGCLLVAEHRNRIVGFHCDRVNRSEASAQLIFAGVRSGAEMYALPMWVEALSRLRDIGVTRTTTMVSASNVGVLNLYATLGFRVESAYLGYRKFLSD